MKLYHVKNNTRVRIVPTPSVSEEDMPAPAGTQFLLEHIDGMFSYCILDDGTVFHPVAWTEVEVVE